MEYDESKKLEVEVSENLFVENRVEENKKRKRNIDVLDMAILPVTLGVFVSLGFLFANLFRATSIVETFSAIADALGKL